MQRLTAVGMCQPVGELVYQCLQLLLGRQPRTQRDETVAEPAVDELGQRRAGQTRTAAFSIELQSADVAADHDTMMPAGVQNVE